MRTRLHRRGLLRRCMVVALGAGSLIALAVCGVACDDLAETSTTDTTVLETTTSVTEATTTTTLAPTTTTEAGSPVSAESTAYAASIGGTDHYGETLWFAIGKGALATEAQAITLLEPAKALGDMQSYFIVQHSSNFDGMTPGYWIIFEAYYENPSQNDLDVLKAHAFPDLYVKSAVVMTHDPIPVRHTSP